MKLLFVHQNLGEFGGAEANIRITANELAARKHTSVLVYERKTGCGEEHWVQTFPEGICLPGDGRPEVLQAVLNRVQPDVIYLHGLSDLSVVEALLDSTIPVVRMIHDHSLYCMRTYKYNYFNRRICTRPFSLYCVFPCLASVARGAKGGRPFRWVSFSQKKLELQLNRRCTALVVYSEYVKRELVQNGFDAEKIVICAPIPRCRDSERISSRRDRNLILFAGQIIRGKGVDVLLESLAKIKTDFHCIILGQGNHLPHCKRRCARLGLSNRVEFKGYVAHAALEQFYREASVFVMSSLWPEPFGMAGPEAMRYGLPVVAFDAGGIREWLTHGESGYLVPWGDTDRFAAALEQLLQNRDIARHMGSRAREAVHRFDAARQVDVLESLFQRVAGNRLQKARPSTPLSCRT